MYRIFTFLVAIAIYFERLSYGENALNVEKSFCCFENGGLFIRTFRCVCVLRKHYFPTDIQYSRVLQSVSSRDAFLLPPAESSSHLEPALSIFRIVFDFVFFHFVHSVFVQNKNCAQISVVWTIF